MVPKGRPVYTIGTAAEILSVHPRTLRLYEDGGLIRPARKNNRRFFSDNDLAWINCVRYLMHEKGLNQEGLRRLLARIPCWQIKGCPPAAMAECESRANWSAPCWALARKGGGDSRECHACAVYLSAADFVLDDQEKQDALSYVKAD